jgi:MFS family permease
VGFYSEKWGRKPLLLVGFGLEIIRALLFAFSANVPILLTAQVLGGISAAAVTVLTILVITDLTTGTGRFNLIRGFIGTVIAIAASISTTQAAWKRPRSAQGWRRKQTIPKSANIMRACGMHGSRWRRDASLSIFLT